MKRAIFAVVAAFLSLAVRIPPVLAQDISQQIGSAAGPFILIVSDRESRIIAEIPLRNNRFDHVFVHSYHLTPVVERFTIVAGTDGTPILHLFELEYESSGVGMPADAEGGYHLVGGKFILDMSRDFAVIPVMVSIVEGHGIAVDDHFYPFTDWVPQETQLFLVAKATPIQ